jgi:TPR repeat protein
MNSLGYSLWSGICVDVDNVEAMCWFRKSVEQGDVAALSSIDVMLLERGRG